MKHKKRFIWIAALGTVLVFFPFAGYGQETAAASSGAKAPPIEQALVPEGVFAVQLVEILKMGKAENEAQAETMLSSAGIEPKNGWIAGYPVTPIIIGEIEKGVAAAADAGKISMGKDEALKALGDLQARLGLSIRPGSAGGPQIPSQPSASAAKSGNVVIYKYVDKNGVVYYTDRYETIPKEYLNQVERMEVSAPPETSGQEIGQGPEVTEVGPPNDYVDYAAVPPPEVVDNYYYDQGPPVVTYYPPPQPYAYLYGWVPYPFWYSGFHFSGFFILHDFHRRVFFNRHPFFVTNHFSRGPGHKMFLVDPVHRTLRGRVAGAAAGSRGFGSPAVRSGAKAIVGHDHGRVASPRVSAPPFRSKVAPPASFGRTQGPGPARLNQGTFNRGTAVSGRNFGSPRPSGERVFRPPASNGRSFSSTPPNVSSRPSLGSRGFQGAPKSGMSSGGNFHRGGGGGMRGGGGSFGKNFGGRR